MTLRRFAKKFVSVAAGAVAGVAATYVTIMVYDRVTKSKES